MRNNNHLYENYWDNSVDDEDNREKEKRELFDRIEKDKPSSKAIAIGVIISVAVVLGAIRLWNVFQRP